MKWSLQQEQALSAVSAWMGDPTSQVMYLAGFAGTGKTTLAKHLADPSSWLFASYTGKSAHVLRQKGCENASTIHSLIYRPAGESHAQEMLLLETRIEQLEGKEKLSHEEVLELNARQKQLVKANADNEPRYALWANSPLNDPNIDGLVVDEVSMVDERLGTDLESFGKKILVLGDPAQLPPIGSGGYFTRRTPDITLTDVHRHAKESGILRLATEIREGGDIYSWAGTEISDVTVHRRCDFDPDDLQMRAMEADQVLCGRNNTRKAANRKHRELIGYKEAGPVRGDRLVCLRNDRELGIFNGAMFTVVEAENDLRSKTSDLELKSDDDGRIIRAPAWLHHMIGCESELSQMKYERRDLSEFTWAYCLTVHKSQGSQYNDVLLIDESEQFGQDARRHLYTGVTRAAKQLTVVIP